MVKYNTCCGVRRAHCATSTPCAMYNFGLLTAAQSTVQSRIRFLITESKNIISYTMVKYNTCFGLSTLQYNTPWVGLDATLPPSTRLD
jgi:hypothetical protein